MFNGLYKEWVNGHSWAHLFTVHSIFLLLSSYAQGAKGVCAKLHMNYMNV